MKKRILSMVLCLVMLCSIMSISAFAAEAPTGTVTVYITQNMFTEGGITADGTVIPQEYINSKEPEENLLDGADWCAQEVPIATIEANQSTLQTVYDGEGKSIQRPNILDAIIYVLQHDGGQTVSGGWDAHPEEGNPGGYINSFSPDGGTKYNDPYTDKVGEKDYTVYSGTGWQVACTQDGVVKEISSYGTNYSLTDGMVIVFDRSLYTIYYPVSAQ